MRDSGEVRYLVLADLGVPYLLARVRWPDVAQAISAASPDWIEDAGLFDLPYDPSAVTVSFPQAVAVAAGWGAQLDGAPGQAPSSYIRRMPANWSALSPSERRAWGVEAIGRAAPARRRRRRYPLATGFARSPARATAGSRGRLEHLSSGNGTVPDERRAHARVGIVGRAHIRCEHTTLTAGLVDLSERGVQLVLPQPPPQVAFGAIVNGPFLLEAEVLAPRICLDVAGRVSWLARHGTGTHFGVALGELDDDETEGVQMLLAAAAGGSGARR